MARLRSTARACTTQVSIMGNCGLWFGSFLGGAIADTRGPRAAMTAGAALFLVGYGGIYLGLSHAVSALRHWQAVAALWLCSGLRELQAEEGDIDWLRPRSFLWIVFTTCLHRL